MKKRQLAILIAIASVLVASSIILCVFLLNRENIAKAEKQYEGTYNSFTTQECDSFMKIDGTLDEEQWQDKAWFHNTGYNVDDTSFPSYDATAFLTDKGVYVAYKLKDSNIVCNGQKNMKKNSCFYIRVTAYQDGEAIGSTYDYQKATFVDMGCGIKGFTNVDRAVVVDGNLNSENTKGATMEAFFSWESLNIDPEQGVPTEVGIIPDYYCVLPGEEVVTYIGSVGGGQGYKGEYKYIFDENGYRDADKDGAVLGCAKNGHTKTPGWDLSKEQEGIVESYNISTTELLFFKDIYAKNMIVEATIIPTSDYQPYASLTRAGFAFVTEGGIYGAACAVTKKDVDCSYETGIFSNVRLFTRIPSGTTINTTHTATAYKNMTNKPGVKLTVVKYMDTYIYFMDGNFMGVEQMPSCAGEVYPALYAVSAGVIFKDYSCREITETDMLDYLNNYDVYRVKTELASGGGNVSVSQNYIKKGENVDVSIVTNKGYEIESVQINDQEKLASLKKTAVDGTFTLDNVRENKNVKVKFAKSGGAKHKLTVLATGDKGFSAELVMTMKSNGLLTHRENLSSGRETVIELPAGTYAVKVIAEGYVIYTTQVNLNKDRTVSAKLKTSAFPEKITVNDTSLTSNRDKFDFSKEGEGKVSTSLASNGKLAPLYFNQTAKDFVVTAKIAYTTNFKTGADYQPDLMGGFFLNEGSTNTWIMAWKDGVRYRGLKTSSSRLTGLTSTNYLVYPEPIPVEFTLVKLGAKVYLYFNGIYGGEMNYTELGPNLDPNKEVAIGLVMLADKNADIEFSNYSLQTGDAIAKKYIEAHKPGNVVSKKLSINPMFAEYNMLGAKAYASATTNFNVTADKVSGSYAMDSRLKTMWLYSAQGSSTALVSAKIKYSSDFKANVDYQKDLFGGFSVASETNLGWIMANQKGTHITGSQRDRDLLEQDVLVWNGTDTPKEVTLTLAVQDRYIYVYFDGVFVKRYVKSAIVDGADKDTKLIYGLRMNTDKAADIEFSDISYTEDANKVSEYISSHK